MLEEKCCPSGSADAASMLTFSHKETERNADGQQRNGPDRAWEAAGKRFVQVKEIVCSNADPRHAEHGQRLENENLLAGYPRNQLQAKDHGCVADHHRFWSRFKANQRCYSRRP